MHLCTYAPVLLCSCVPVPPFLTPLSQFIGLDSETTKSEFEQHAMLARHFGAIDAHPLWRQARKIFIPENNLGLEASHMETMVGAYRNVTTYRQKPDRPGVCMTNAIKREYQLHMVHSLYNRSLLYERDVFTTNRDRSVETMRGMLRAQLERFHRVVKPAADDFQNERVAITGKTAAQDENGQDDLAIAGMMAPFWGTQHREEVIRNMGPGGTGPGNAYTVPVANL